MSVSIEDLKRVELFSQLQPSVLERISKTLRHLTVSAGHVIVKQGAVANDMFFIISGTRFP
jgi:CRP-like cAMP-binding protein